MSQEVSVLKYLSDSNRPYSCIDIVTNLRGSCGKTAAQKALDALVASGKVREKQYGKQRVYVVAQNNQVEAGSEDEMKELESAYARSSEALLQAESTVRTLDATLRELLSEPTTEDAGRLTAEAAARVAAGRAKLQQLQESAGEAPDKDQRDAIVEEHANIVREYRKRKRICMDMLDAVLEGYPKSKTALMEEISLETDEDAGFKLSTH